MEKRMKQPLDAERLISVKLNLDKFSPTMIIDMCDRSIITIKEIQDSGRAHSCFSEILADYVHAKTRNGVYNMWDNPTLLNEVFRK